jgi:hypothetical protein
VIFFDLQNNTMPKFHYREKLFPYSMAAIFRCENCSRQIIRQSLCIIKKRYLCALDIMYKYKVVEMETMEIIQQIDRLPLTQKMWVIEKIVHSIREDEHKIVLQRVLVQDLSLNQHFISKNRNFVATNTN